MKICGYNINGKSVCTDLYGNIIMETEVMYITPDVAKKFLTNNPNNRKLREPKVAAIVNDMKNGMWKLNGESIVFKANGELADGQHRLSAIIASGVPSLEIVVTVPNEEAKNYDIGLTRSTGDLISFSNDENLKRYNNCKLIGAVTFLLRLKNNYSKGNISKPLIIKEMEHNSDVLDWYINSPHAVCRGKAGIGMSPVIAAILAAYKNGYSEEKLNEFCKVLCDGISNSAYHIPIIKLRDWLMNGAKSFGDGNSRQVEVYLRTVYILKAFEKNNSKAICKAAIEDYYKW